MSHLLIVKRLELYMDLALYKINILLLLLLLFAIMPHNYDIMQSEYLSFNLQNQLLLIIWYKIVNRASKKKRLTVTDIGHPAPYSVIMGTHTSSGCLNSVTRSKHCYLICKLLLEIHVAPRIAKLAHRDMLSHVCLDPILK